MFKAIWLEKDDAGTRADVRDITQEDLGQGDVLVRVEWSTLNYKDALAITGKSPVVRSFPLIPGIDLAGSVESSANPAWQPGDKVVLTGFGYGETKSGGLSQRARVEGDKLVRLPGSLSTHDAMSIGTAGFTAMLSVLALERHGVRPDDGEVLVTGAGGGVGGFAVALLARRGYRVVASTGRPGEAARLQRLGAAEVIDRATLSEPGRPLGKERWAGVVDCVGSHTLANACASTRYGGCVAACGLAQGMDFPATVAPFILRGVTLAGIDSVYAPMPLRQSAWQRLETDLGADAIRDMVGTIGIDGVIPAAADLLEGRISGRLVVDLA